MGKRSLPDNPDDLFHPDEEQFTAFAEGDVSTLQNEEAEWIWNHFSTCYRCQSMLKDWYEIERFFTKEKAEEMVRRILAKLEEQ